jgi:type II secretion system protein N
MMKNSGKIVLYSVFTGAMIILFLFIRFPSEIASNLIIERIAQVEPELSLFTQEVHPVFPPGIRLAPLEITYAGIPLVNAEYLKIKPGLLSMLRSEKNFAFNGLLTDGDIKGNAIVKLDKKQRQILLTMNLEDVPLETLPALKLWPQYQPSGVVKAYIDYDSLKGAGGTAKINLEVTPVKIVFDPPIMGLEQIDFSQLQSELTVTPRMIQIRRGDASGTQLEGRISGSIIFRQPMESSRITFSCTLKPQPAFIAEHKNDMLGGLLGSENAQKRGVVLRISGTLGNPRYIIR